MECMSYLRTSLSKLLCLARMSPTSSSCRRSSRARFVVFSCSERPAAVVKSTSSILLRTSAGNQSLWVKCFVITSSQAECIPPASPSVLPTTVWVSILIYSVTAIERVLFFFLQLMMRSLSNLSRKRSQNLKRRVRAG